MKKKSIKKLLTVTLVAAMLVGSTLTAAAAGSGGSGGAAGAPGSSSGPSSSGSSSSSSSKSSHSSSSSSSSGASSAPSVTTVSPNKSVAVAGASVRNTISGAIKADTLRGVAVTTPLAEVKASLGLNDSQTPYVVVFDTDVKKSNLAMNCVNAAAEALGGQVVTAINVTLGAKENGRMISLSNGSAGMVVGLPANADTTKTYYVVCVQPGGVVSLLEDQDSTPATVTFAVQAGLGTYGILAK